MKTKFMELEGVVLESLQSAQFKIKLNNGEEIRAYLCGKMRQNHIKVLVGDRILLEVSPDILLQNQIGRIIYRK